MDRAELETGTGRRVVRAAAAFVAIAATLLTGSATGQASFITNGSFEQTTAGDSSGNPSQVTNSNLTGWSIAGGGGTPYDFVVMNGNNGFYNGYNNSAVTFNFNPGVSPDGGNYIAANSDDFVGTLSQTISGLTPNTAYAVTFYEASTSQTGFSESFTGFWKVSLGGTTLNSTQMATSGGGGTTWIMDTLIFTAASASQVLSFVAADTSGQPPFILLDGVSMSQVPEPATLGLAGAGFAGLLLARRRRRAAKPPPA